MARGNRLDDIQQACRDQGIGVDVAKTGGGHVRYTKGAQLVTGSSTSYDYFGERKLIGDLRRYLGFEWPWSKAEKKRRARRDLKATLGELAGKADTPTFSEALRSAVKEDGSTLAEVAAALEVDESVLVGICNMPRPVVKEWLRDGLVDLFPQLGDVDVEVVVGAEPQRQWSPHKPIANGKPLNVPPDPPEVKTGPLPAAKPRETTLGDLEQIMRASAGDCSVDLRLSLDPATGFSFSLERSSLSGPTPASRTGSGATLEDVVGALRSALRAEFEQRRRSLLEAQREVDRVLHLMGGAS